MHTFLKNFYYCKSQPIIRLNCNVNVLLLFSLLQNCKICYNSKNVARIFIRQGATRY